MARRFLNAAKVPPGGQRFSSFCCGCRLHLWEENKYSPWRGKNETVTKVDSHQRLLLGGKR
jgi:hypothetical protein